MSEIFAIPGEIMFDAPDGVLPQPETVNYYKLAKERILFYGYDVDETLIEMQKQILCWNIEDKGKPVEERKPIWLYFISHGGDMDFMWSFVDFIAASDTPIYTVNLGFCDSAAGLIFMSGHKRFMLKSSRLIIHEGSAEVGGDAQKVLDAMERYEKDLKRMKAYILSKTNIPKATLNKKRSNDWTLDAKYCLENGVCDVVIEHLSEVI